MTNRAIGTWACLLLFALVLVPPARGAEPTIVLKAWGVPEQTRNDIDAMADRMILEAFRDRRPDIKPVAPTGIEIPGRQSMDFLPLMQIAGDIAPDVLYVNFRQSDTFVQNKFLYPLDRYIEKLVGLEVPHGHLLDAEAYLAAIQKAPGYERELADRIPHQCWPVMRRECPYGAECPYLKTWHEAPLAKHYHTWCFPEGPDFIAIFYRKDLLFEAGLPDRAPETIEELLEWSRKLTNPKEDRFGMEIPLAELGWSTLSFLYSEGGRIVERDEAGEWHCVFDSEEAVEAYYQVARFFLEPFQNAHGKYSSVVYLEQPQGTHEVKCAMQFNYLDQRFFGNYDPSQWGFGPVPAGATGQRGSEFNARMAGIYAGLEDDPVRRDAAWDYVRFYDSPEARPDDGQERPGPVRPPAAPGAGGVLRVYPPGAQGMGGSRPDGAPARRPGAIRAQLPEGLHIRVESDRPDPDRRRGPAGDGVVRPEGGQGPDPRNPPGARPAQQ